VSCGFAASSAKTFQLAGIVALDGILTAVNKNGGRVLRRARKRRCRQIFWDTPWWEHSEELRNWLREAGSRLRQGETLRREVTIVSKDGDLHDFDFSLKPVVDDDGKVQLLDTPRAATSPIAKRAEDALRAARSSTAHWLRQPTLSSVVVRQRGQGSCRKCGIRPFSPGTRNPSEIRGRKRHWNGPPSHHKQMNAKPWRSALRKGRQKSGGRLRPRSGQHSRPLRSMATLVETGGTPADSFPLPRHQPNASGPEQELIRASHAAEAATSSPPRCRAGLVAGALGALNARRARFPRAVGAPGLYALPADAPHPVGGHRLALRRRAAKSEFPGQHEPTKPARR